MTESDQLAEARAIGAADAKAGRAERDVMWDDASAWLMAQVGETGPTTADNHPLRYRLCEAYVVGYHAGECAA